jgi:hypothetical protein
LTHLDGEKTGKLNFVSRPPHFECEGVNNQEVLRALIDRVFFLDAEKPWGRNAEIIMHLRKALLLHELRALELHVDKGEIAPEKIAVGRDGHFRFDTNG